MFHIERQGGKKKSGQFMLVACFSANLLFTELKASTSGDKGVFASVWEMGAEVTSPLISPAAPSPGAPPPDSSPRHPAKSLR